MALVPSAGGASLTFQKQEFHSDVKIDGSLVVTGTINSNGATGPTITDPTIADGLTASGSASNDFSGSTGTFKTSSGANQLSGAVTISASGTPSLTTAAGSTNTGFVQINGKTSGALKFLPADATAQTVTVATAAQTTGASTLTIPDQAGVSSSFVFTTLAQTLTNKTITGVSLAVTGAVTSSGTAGIGYATGAGGAGTQTGSRTTTIVNSKICGSLTLVSAAGSATPASCTVTNTLVAATDTVVICQKSGTDKYEVFVTAVGTGSFEITFFTTGGTTTETPVFNFAVIKAVAA